MKINLKLFLTFAILSICLLSNVTKAQKLNCPYTINNYRSCTVCLNWEVRQAGVGTCPTPCNGNICIPPSPGGGVPSTFTIPMDCCVIGDNVIVTVLTIGGNTVGITHCEGPGTCVPNNPVVVIPAPWCGAPYNLTWSTSAVNIQ